MSNVLSYLDCGCAITNDGRVWCPTCSSPAPAKNTGERYKAAIVKFIRELDFVISQGNGLGDLDHVGAHDARAALDTLRKIAGEP